MERPSSGTVFPVDRSPDCDSQNGGSAETIGKGNPFPGNGFHERRPDCGSRNGESAERAGKGKTNPAGWFSMSALGAAASAFKREFFDSRGGHRESRGDFALCGARPGSTWTGQPTRLDRAGPWARTRLSPAGGIPFAARWCLRCFLGDLVIFRFLLPFLSLFLTPFSSLMTR